MFYTYFDKIATYNLYLQNEIVIQYLTITYFFSYSLSLNKTLRGFFILKETLFELMLIKQI